MSLSYKNAVSPPNAGKHFREPPITINKSKVVSRVVPEQSAAAAQISAAAMGLQKIPDQQSAVVSNTEPMAPTPKRF